MSIGSKVAPGEFDFMPPSFNFPQDKELFEIYCKNNPKAVYIAKPQNGAQGDGIVLFKELK